MKNFCFIKVPGSQYYTISSPIDREAYMHLPRKTGITLVEKLKKKKTQVQYTLVKNVKNIFNEG